MCAVVVNKAVLSSWSFHFPLTMIASQMVISFLLLWVLKQCELIQYDDWSLATAKKVRTAALYSPSFRLLPSNNATDRLPAQVWPIALAHVGNVLLGLAALNLVDIPMFGYPSSPLLVPAALHFFSRCTAADLLWCDSGPCDGQASCSCWSWSIWF